MAVARTRVERTSAALREIGGFAIEVTDSGLPDEFDDYANAALDVFDACVPIALYAPAWSWLIRRASLVEAVIPADEEPLLPRKWSLPGGAAAVGSIRSVYESKDEDARPLTTGWTRSGEFLYTEMEIRSVYLEYLVALPPESWPLLFGAAFHLLLCSRLAIQVIQDQALGAHYLSQYNGIIENAERVDSQSKPVAVIPLEKFGHIASRFGGGPAGAGYRRS